MTKTSLAGVGVPIIVDRAGPPEPFTCPRCGATSWNPVDREEGYCGRCHDWPVSATETATEVIADWLMARPYSSGVYRHGYRRDAEHLVEQLQASQIGFAPLPQAANP